MTYGITPEGFVKPRMPEIRAQIIDSMNAKLSALAGRAITVETGPKSITGPLVDTFAEREAAIWERMEAQYLAMYPNTAERVSLDNALAFTGGKRLQPLKTKVFGLHRGPVGTVVKAGTVATSSFDQSVYSLTQDVTVSDSAAAAFRVEVKTVAEGNYTITVGSNTHTYAAPLGVTTSDIIANLTAFLQGFMNASSFVGYIDAEFDGRVSSNVSVSPNLLLTNVETIGLYQATEDGPSEVPSGALSGTATGITSIRNIVPGVIGRFVESDNEVRRNYDLGPFRLGRATADAIRANIRENVPGVTDLIVVENEEETTNAAGIPAGGIEVIIQGGDDQEIRDEIRRVKGAGTPAYGLSAGTSVDSEGTAHPIGLTRPQILFSWVLIQVILKPNSAISANTFSDMKIAVAALGNTYGIGEMVVRQLLEIPVMESTSAISSIDIKVYATTDSEYEPVTGDYVEENITPTQRQRAVFSPSRVVVF